MLRRHSVANISCIRETTQSFWSKSPQKRVRSDIEAASANKTWCSFVSDSESSDDDVENQLNRTISTGTQRWPALKRRCVANKVAKRREVLAENNVCTQAVIDSRDAIPLTPFRKARSAFTQVRRIRSDEGPSSLRSVFQSIAPIETQIEEYDEKEEEAEEEGTHICASLPSTELDLLLDLIAQETQPAVVDRRERLMPQQLTGYWQQLYHTLETSDADYKFLKHERASGFQRGTILQVRQLHESFGVHLAVVEAPAHAACDMWMLVLAAEVAAQVTVGSQLEAFLDTEHISNAYCADALQISSLDKQKSVIFVQPNKVLPL